MGTKASQLAPRLATKLSLPRVNSWGAVRLPVPTELATLRRPVCRAPWLDVFDLLSLQLLIDIR